MYSSQQPPFLTKDFPSYLEIQFPLFINSASVVSTFCVPCIVIGTGNIIYE